MFIRIFALSLIFGATGLFAAPSGGRVTAGDGELSNPLNIIQHSDTLATSWESFDIAADEVVNIVQPSASALISIKVRNGSATNINGALNANGRVALENPAGVLFGAGSVVNVGGLLASASGTAGAVQANGVINAPLGEVHLQSLSNNNVVNIGGTIEAQRIIVEGAGEVKLDSTARLTASKEVLVGGGFQGNGTIANSQKTIVESGAFITAPRVIIWSDVSTNFQGSIDASQKNGKGGFVEVSGKKHLASFDILKIKAAKLLLDPDSITIISGDEVGQDDGEIEDDGSIGPADTEAGFVLSAKAIEDRPGDVSLVADVTIFSLKAINKSNGSLTLEAPSISIKKNIAITGHDLTINASTNIILTQSTTSLSGAAVLVTSGQVSEELNNRTLTITATSRLTLTGNFNFGDRGDLTVKGAAIVVGAAATSISARNISLEGTSSVQGNQAAHAGLRGGADLTLTATGNIVIKATHVNFNVEGSLDDLTLSAGSSILFRQNTSVIATNLTLSKTIKAQATSGARHNLTLTATTGSLNFPDNAATTISGAAVSLRSTTQGTITNNNLTVSASGNITLQGIFNTGNHATNGGVMFLTAGSGDGTGKIIFTNTGSTKPALTARAITMRQDSAAFATAAPATITLPDSVKPLVYYTGGDTQPTSDWFVLANPTFILTGESNNINIMALIETNSSIAGGVFAGFSISGGVLDFGDKDITLSAEGNITFPNSVTEIRARSLTLVAANIGTGTDGTTAFSANLSINVVGNLSLSGALASTGTLTLNSTSLTIVGATALSATTLTIITPRGTGTGDLTLAASTAILFPQNTNIQARNITLGGVVKAESASGITPVQYDLTLTAMLIEGAGGQINFADDKTTTISGENITLASPTKGAPSGHDLTLTTTNRLTMSGHYTVGAADAFLSFKIGGAGRTPSPSSFTANNLTLALTTPLNTQPQTLQYKPWMAGAVESLTLNAPNDLIYLETTTIDLTGRDLILFAGQIEALAGRLEVEGSITLTAKNITMTADPSKIGNSNLGLVFIRGGLTLNATEDIILEVARTNHQGIVEVGSPLSQPLPRSLTLSAGGEIIFKGDTIIEAHNLSLSGTIKAQSTNEASITTQHDLTLLATGQINFAADEATTITGADISIISTTQGTASGHALTITASREVILGGALDTGAGDMIITSGAGQPINFLAASIPTTLGTMTTLTTTLISTGNITLTATGGTPTASDQDLTITATGALTMSGDYDIGTGDAALSFGGTTAQNPAPDSLLTDSLTLTHTGTAQINGADWMGGAGRNLMLIAETGFVGLAGIDLGDDGGNITRGDLTVRAKAFFVLQAGDNILKAKDISITATDTTDGENAGFRSDAGSLTLNASNNITISARHIDFFTGEVSPFDLTLIAGGATTFTQDTDIARVRNLTLSGVVKAESGSGTPTQHNLKIVDTRGQLIFDNATTISGADITLTSPTAQTTASDQDLTIIATGVLTLSGDFNIGTGDAALTFAGTAEQAPAPDSFLTDDLTLTYTSTASSTLYLGYAAWMAAAGRNLTLKAAKSSIRDIASINLGDDDNPNLPRGNLTLSAIAIVGADADNSADPAVIKANDININPSSMSDTAAHAGFRSGGSITLDASNDITIGAFYVNFNVIGDSDDLTLIAGSGNIFFPQATDIKAGNLTLGGTLEVKESATFHNITITLTAALNFAIDKQTTIRADNITLISPTAGTASNNKLTLDASQNITLQGGFNLGSGGFDILAGRGDSVTGVIAFTATASVLPTITAAAVLLEQNGDSAVYAADSTAPATFTLPNGDTLKPRVRYDGSGNQVDPTPDSWFEFAPENITFDAGEENITIADLLAVDSALANGDFAAFSIDENGLLDFGNEDVILATEGSIIFPDTIRTIRARNLTLTAASIVSSGGNFSADLTLDISEALTLSVGSFTSPLTVIGTLTLEATSLTLAGDSAFSATTLTIMIATVTGTGDLTLAAGTAILFPQDTNIEANNITLSGVVKAESGDPASPAQHDLTLTATEQLTFADDKATTISGADITLASPTVQTSASDQALTITATGVLMMSGDYNLGEGNAALTFGGTAEQNPAPDSLLTDDLTLTYTAAGELSFAAWMAGEASENRNLTLTSRNIFINIDENINLGSGNLTINMGVEDVVVAADTTITANNISISNTVDPTTGRKEGIQLINQSSLTLNASGNLSLDFQIIEGTDQSAVTLEAGGEIVFAQSTETIGGLGNLTLGGTIRAISTSGGTTTQHDLTLVVTGKITFADDKATTITAANISLTSPTAQTTPSNQNLTITASGNITLEGSFDIGNDATLGGMMTLTAGEGAGAGNIGTIIFTETASVKPVLKAKEIILTQDGAVFVPSPTAPATFSIANNGKPRARYTGDGTQADPASNSWFSIPRLFFDAGDSNINIAALIADGSTLADGDFAGFSISGGVLDFGNERVEISTTGNIIFPAGITEIRANSLALNATNMGAGSANGSFTDLKISVETNLILPAVTLTGAGTLTLEADDIVIRGGAEDASFTLNANDIMITARLGVASVLNLISSFRSNSRPVVFNATNNLIISVPFLSVGDPSGKGARDLTLNAGNQILFTRSSSITAKSIFLSDTIKAESSSGGTPTQHNLSFYAVIRNNEIANQGSINFATNKPTTITAQDVTLITSPTTATATGQDLTIKVSRNTIFQGKFDIGGGTMTLEASLFSTSQGSLNPFAGASTTFCANNIIVRTMNLSGNPVFDTTSIVIDTHFNATNNITFSTAFIDAASGSNSFVRSTTFTAGGQLLFTRNTTLSAPHGATFNVGTIKAEMPSEDSATPIGVSLSMSGIINFSPTEATTISGGDISINALAQSVASEQDLTINASGNITLQGSLDIGGDATTGGALSLTAGSGSGSGTIIFTSTSNVKPALTARMIFLTQDGAVFDPGTSAPATFSVKPRAFYSGTTLTQTEPSESDWFRLDRIVFNAAQENIDITTLIADDSSDAGGDFAIFSINNAGTLNFDRENIVLTTEMNIILPSNIREIKARSLILTATSIGTGDGTGLSTPLTLVASERVIIDADIISTRNIIIKAPEVVFSSTKPVRLSGQDIMIDLPDDMDTPNDMPLANNQNVELVATGDIMLNNNINVGFGTLKLEANRIMTANADVVIMGNRVEVDSGTDNNIRGGLTIISMNDIRLLGNIETEGNVILRAGGSIITPNAPTTIEATGGITFEQKYALRQSFALTLKAAGEIAIIGKLDRGTAEIRLEGGSLDLAGASFIAGGIRCVGVRAEICQ